MSEGPNVIGTHDNGWFGLIAVTSADAPLGRMKVAAMVAFALEELSS